MTLRLYEPDPCLWDGVSPASWTLRAESARHVQVRRLQPGDDVRLFDGAGRERAATVAAMTRKDVAIVPGPAVTPLPEPPIAITLALAVPANERMDFLVEKATELGVGRIVPLQCERSVVRLDGERALRRVEHWRAIAVAASQQAGRAVVPRVDVPAGLREWLDADRHAAADAPRRILSPGAGVPPLAASRDAIDRAGAVGFLSGPEGGFTNAEEDAAGQAGWQRASLGARILRADTAPLAALAWAIVESGSTA